MSKICILGDTHFGMRGDSLDFHRYCQKFYNNVFFPYLIENKIDTVFQLGDLFDRRKFINFNSLYLSRKYFFDKLKSHGIKLHTLLGNHDVAYKNTLEVNSTGLLLGEYDNIVVHKDFETVTISDINIDVVPCLCDDNQEGIFEKIKQSKSQLCFGHFEIDGFEMDRGNICHGGIDRKSLIKYDMVLTGHFHHKSDDGHIYYVGTPGEMTWADYNDPRGFHIFDLNTRQLEFIQNPYRMFHKISYDDSQTDFEYWKNFDYESLKETYVKVVAINKQNPYLFDNVIDNLYKVGVSDLSIVEDFTETMVEDDQDIVNQAEDTMTILSKYIDNLTLNVEPEKLKTLMRELYIEALNSESTAE
jgi:DNA repair exonuclease SbcCD nuclease subunit